MENLKYYANSLIIAFELKKPMKAKALTGREFGIVLGYIKQYLAAKKSGILGTVQILNDYEIVSQRAKVEALTTK
ncbi:TPA: hypothetical protein ACPDRM_002197 [Pasteurella multocida]